MKIFDYKFLILLGLSLVVYFIYREVEYLRAKVDKLEKEVKAKSDNLITDKSSAPNILEQNNLNAQPKSLQNKPVLALPKPPDQIMHTVQTEPDIKPSGSLDISLNVINDKSEVSIAKPSPKMISVDMSPSKTNDQLGFESGVKLTKIAKKKKTNSDSETSSESSSSKHLAIYSNDNEQYDETQNSLLESIESGKLELNFNYEEKGDIPNLKTNVNELISMVTSPVDSVSNSEKTTENKPDSESESMSIEGVSFTNDKQLTSSEKLNESELEKKKLPELKKIAESKKIILTKKVNGQQKPKNKQELIKEIIGQKVANTDN